MFYEHHFSNFDPNISNILLKYKIATFYLFSSCILALKIYWLKMLNIDFYFLQSSTKQKPLVILFENIFVFTH